MCTLLDYVVMTVQIGLRQDGVIEDIDYNNVSYVAYGRSKDGCILLKLT